MIHKHEYLVQKCKGKRVLHIGATDEPFHIERAKNKTLLHTRLQKVAKKIIGIDYSKQSINDLKEYGINDIYYGDIVTGTFAIDLSQEEFDIILFPDVIEHLTNPGQALNVLKSLASSHTTIIITTPNVWSLFYMKNVFRSHESVHPDHTFWPSKRTMTHMITQSNLRITHFSYGLYARSKHISFLGKLFKKLILTPFPHFSSMLVFEIQK